jgi:hypothetical protein
MVFFSVFNYFNGEVVFRFVDIGGIVDHHCLNFLFIIISINREAHLSMLCLPGSDTA